MVIRREGGGGSQLRARKGENTKEREVGTNQHIANTEYDTVPLPSWSEEQHTIPRWVSRTLERHRGSCWKAREIQISPSVEFELEEERTRRETHFSR